jgi:acyl-lipid omega-3 desaturase
MKLYIDVQTQPIPSSAASRSTDLPFTLADVRAAIPNHCFKPNTARSLAYCAWDFGVIAGLYTLAAQIDKWWFLPIFWFAQGTMFWALFVVGHDCGHGSFSKHKWLNNLIGHITHTPILVPFHGWRISHRTHHANTGSVENDESWYPVSATTYQNMGAAERLVRFTLPLFAYPLYLFRRSSGKGGSHFLPSSDLFKPSERNAVLTSTACLIAFVGFLGWITATFGLVFFVKYYLIGYLGFVVWLDLVTYLHHTEDDIPWYRNEEWYFLKGALSTIDRNYGFINWIHHDIGTHVAHHVFSNMPHYYLQDATEGIKPLLGKYYRKSDENVLVSFWNSYWKCQFVPDTGAKVYYQPKNALKS